MSIKDSEWFQWFILINFIFSPLFLLGAIFGFELNIYERILYLSLFLLSTYFSIKNKELIIHFLNNIKNNWKENLMLLGFLIIITTSFLKFNYVFLIIGWICYIPFMIDRYRNGKKSFFINILVVLIINFFVFYLYKYIFI